MVPLWQFVGRFGRLRPSPAPATPPLPQDTNFFHFHACSSTRIASNAAGGAHVAVSSPLGTALWWCLNRCLSQLRHQSGAYIWCLIPTKAPNKGTAGALPREGTKQRHHWCLTDEGTKYRHHWCLYSVPYRIRCPCSAAAIMPIYLRGGPQTRTVFGYIAPVHDMSLPLLWPSRWAWAVAAVAWGWLARVGLWVGCGCSPAHRAVHPRQYLASRCLDMEPLVGALVWSLSLVPIFGAYLRRLALSLKCLSPRHTAVPSLSPLLQLDIADDRGNFYLWHDNPAVDAAGDQPWATGWYLHTPVLPWCYRSSGVSMYTRVPCYNRCLYMVP